VFLFKRIRKIRLTGLTALLLIAFLGQGQDLSKSYRVVTTDLGQLYDGSQITVKTYSFNYSIYNKQIDTVKKNIYFTVREKDASGKFYKNNGYQFAFDLNKDTIAWVNDVRKFDIAQDMHDDLMISSEVNTSRFNKTTGLEQYQHATRLVYSDEKYKIGLTYSIPVKPTDKKVLKGVNIETGAQLYTTDIPNDFDWVEAIKANDSILLISSSGLYGLNIRSGATWSLGDITGEKNKQKLIQSIMNPNAFRVRQTSFLASPFDDVISQVCSNILLSGENALFAGKNNLYSVNVNSGKTNWKLDISKYNVSKSALFVQNGKLYMLNLGVANFKENQIIYGAPFLMQVDLSSGAMNFNNPLPMFAYPVDFQIGSTDLVLAGRNNLYFINLSDGKFFNEIDVNELRYGNFSEFVSGNDYYVEKEGYFVPLNFINDNVVYFHSTHGKVYGVEGGRIQYEYHESELYKYDAKFSGFRLIEQKFKTYVLNQNFELVAVLDMEEPSTVVKDKLFFFSGRKLHILSANNFRKPQQ
jgi:outer membrane protein assembly factor BamB